MIKPLNDLPTTLTVDIDRRDKHLTENFLGRQLLLKELVIMFVVTGIFAGFILRSLPSSLFLAGCGAVCWFVRHRSRKRFYQRLRTLLSECCDAKRYLALWFEIARFENSERRWPEVCYHLCRALCFCGRWDDAHMVLDRYLQWRKDDTMVCGAELIHAMVAFHANNVKAINRSCSVAREHMASADACEDMRTDLVELEHAAAVLNKALAGDIVGAIAACDVPHDEVTHDDTNSIANSAGEGEVRWIWQMRQPFPMEDVPVSHGRPSRLALVARAWLAEYLYKTVGYRAKAATSQDAEASRQRAEAARLHNYVQAYGGTTWFVSPRKQHQSKKNRNKRSSKKVSSKPPRLGS